MPTLTTILEYLKVAASSPLAFAAYVCVVVAWVARIWIVTGPRQRAERILAQFNEDRARSIALKDLLGASPPLGLKKSEIMDWVRAKSSENTRGYLLVAYLATLLSVVIVAGLTSYVWYNDDGSRPVKLLRENVSRGNP